MNKTPIYRADITGLAMTCGAALNAIDAAGNPIVLANVQKALEQVVGVIRSLPPMGYGMEVPDKYCTEPGIDGMISGVVERVPGIPETVDPTVILPSVDGKLALVLVNVDDLMAPLSSAATWRHEWLAQLREWKIDSVVFREVGTNKKWRLTRREGISRREDIEPMFGDVATARARQDVMAIILCMEPIDG